MNKPKCPVRCGECGSKEVYMKNAIDRGFAYKQYDKVILTVDCELWTCSMCDNIISGPGDAKRLDQAIEDSLTRALG
jgi:hypothetical protein